MPTVFSRNALCLLTSLWAIGCAVPDTTGQSALPFPILCGLPPNAYTDVTDNEARRILTVDGTSSVRPTDESIQIDLTGPEDRPIVWGSIWIYAGQRQRRIDLAQNDAAVDSYLNWLDCEADYGRRHPGLSLLVAVPRGEPVQIFARVLTADHRLLNTGTLTGLSCGPGELRVTAFGRNTKMARTAPAIDASLCVVELVP